MSGEPDGHHQAPGPRIPAASRRPSEPAESWWANSAPHAPAGTEAVTATDSPAIDEDLRAGALIVGLERRRRRVKAEGKSNAWFALPALVVVALGLLAFGLNGTHGNLLPAALLSVTVGLFGFLYVLKRLVDDDPDEECTPAELAQLVGYVTGHEDGTWATTPRGHQAKDAYLALDHQPQTHTTSDT